tara:strand:- start:30231 stop:31034 length:804 start_codon:yes stop_codon:yes gene_type:complete
MKAIILAAGLGTRLGKYTEDLPKCMLNFNGESLIERQVATLRAAGVTDISIVRGFNPDKINVKDVKYYFSKDFASTNMVETLFSAELEMEDCDGLLVCYADILYEPRIVQKIMASDVNVGVCVDSDYWEYWQARTDFPENDMESMVIEGDKIVDLGNTDCTRTDAEQRYVGLIKFSGKGIVKLREIYHEHRQKYFNLDQPWLRSKSFKKAYMTCMIQALINSGVEVKPVTIQRGWLEFDTVEDYEKYTQWLQDGSLGRFYDVNSFEP